MSTTTKSNSLFTRPVPGPLLPFFCLTALLTLLTLPTTQRILTKDRSLETNNPTQNDISNTLKIEDNNNDDGAPIDVLTVSQNMNLPHRAKNPVMDVAGEVDPEYFDKASYINKYIGRAPRPPGKLTEEFYLSKEPIQFTCVEHVKMLEIGFSCMDADSLDPEEVGIVEPDVVKGANFRTFFVVSKNNRKYFMKIMSNMYDLEHFLEDKFYNDDIAQTLIEYKIVKGRFVGIYAYYGHENTLYHNIVNKQLSFLDKLLIMKKMATFASVFYEEVEPQNNILKLNFLSSNILITKEGYNTIRLINILRSSTSELGYLTVPEYYNWDESTVVNQKLSNVYVMSRAFYFILFLDELGAGNFMDLKGTIFADFRFTFFGFESEIYNYKHPTALNFIAFMPPPFHQENIYPTPLKNVNLHPLYPDL